MAIRSLKTGQFSRSTLVGNPVIMPGSYESIATVTVGSGGASSVEFTSIPSTYTHLQVRLFAKNVAAGSDGSYLQIEINGNTTSSYAYHRLNGTGATASSVASTGANSIFTSYMLYTDGYTSIFGTGILDILDYKDTNKNKTIRFLGGADVNGGGNISLVSGFWTGSGATNAVTSLKFYSQDSRNLAQYSHFALYGVN